MVVLVGVLVLMLMLVSMVMVVVVLMLVFMVMVVVLVALLLAVDQHVHMGAHDAAAGLPLGGHRHTGNQVVHGLQKLLLLRAQLQQRPHEHIPRRAHGAVQIQCFQGKLLLTYG